MLHLLVVQLLMSLLPQIVSFQGSLVFLNIRNCPGCFPLPLFLADFPGRGNRFLIQESDGRCIVGYSVS